MRDGIKRIADFGKGTGYKDAKGNTAKRNDDFLDEFKRILTDNMVNP